MSECCSHILSLLFLHIFDCWIPRLKKIHIGEFFCIFRDFCNIRK